MMDIATALIKFREEEAKKAAAKVKRAQKKAAAAKQALEAFDRVVEEATKIAIAPLEDELEAAKATLEAAEQRMVEFNAKVAARKNAKSKPKSI